MNIKAISSLSMLAITALLSGCDSDGSKEEIISNEDDYSHQIPEVKKGSVFNNQDLIWSNQLAEIKPHWNHDWSSTRNKTFQPSSIEFVPTFATDTVLTDEQVAELKKYYIDYIPTEIEVGENGDEVEEILAEEKFHYVLTSYEHEDVVVNPLEEGIEATVNIDGLLAAWEKLVEIGAPMVSPATEDPLNPWMTEFMQQQGDTVSYVALQWFGAPDVDALMAKVDETYAAYGKPVWITEFAVADMDAMPAVEGVEAEGDTPAIDAIPAIENKYTEQEVVDFIKTALPALDEHTNVFRYSWFSVEPEAENFINFSSSRLFDARDMDTGKTTPTIVAEAYAFHTPNGYAGFGKTPALIDEIPGNLIVNGHFENATDAPWLGYLREVVLGTEAIPATDGVFYGRINNNSDGSFLQLVDLEEGKSYKLNFNARFHSGVGKNTMNVVVKENESGKTANVLKAPIVLVDGEWSENEFIFEASLTGNYKLSFWHGKETHYFYLDSVSLVEVTDETEEGGAE
ncbi:glycosyl hydrolase [Thalassotalea sp. PLHSN55]|uniref:glycosyl hydrolase n=1 Tax=Thalassotalea sp. PLHSN55 TaxID=3435888 RepID=UPI003F82EF14